MKLTGLLYLGKKVTDDKAKERRRRQIERGQLRAQNGLVLDSQLRHGGRQHDGAFVTEERHG